MFFMDEKLENFLRESVTEKPWLRGRHLKGLKGKSGGEYALCVTASQNVCGCVVDAIFREDYGGILDRGDCIPFYVSPQSSLNI